MNDYLHAIHFLSHYRTQAFSYICNSWRVIKLTLPYWPIDILVRVLNSVFFLQDQLPYKSYKAPPAIQLMWWEWRKTRWVHVFSKSISTKGYTASSRIWTRPVNSILFNDKHYIICVSTPNIGKIASWGLQVYYWLFLGGAWKVRFCTPYLVVTDD